MESYSQTSAPPQDPLVQQILIASETGNVSLIKTLFTQFLADNSSPHLELIQPALNIAASNKQSSVCSYLLDQGLEIDYVVIKAALHGASTDVLGVLLDYGWDINKSLGPTHGYVLTMSHVLENESLLAWLLAHGASPNIRNHQGRGPIYVAARMSSPSIVNQLLENGGTLHNSNALHCAIRSPKSTKCNYEMVKYLLDVGVEIDTIEGASCPRRVRDRYGTALHYAAERGREDIVRLLLDRGANVEKRDKLGRTAKQVAEEAWQFGIVSILSGEESE